MFKPFQVAAPPFQPGAGMGAAQVGGPVFPAQVSGPGVYLPTQDDTGMSSMMTMIMGMMIPLIMMVMMMKMMGGMFTQMTGAFD